jgi:heme exporter protein B
MGSSAAEVSKTEQIPMGQPGLLWLALLVMRREFKLVLRRWGEAAQPIIFFMIITALFPLAISPELAELRRISAGVAWVAAMLSSLLALESLFRSDVEDGTMEQWVLSGQPLAWLLLAKACAHWLVTGLPLVLISPLVGMALGMPSTAWPALMASLLLGTVSLSLFGGVGAALTVSVRKGSVLLALLVLPLEVPVLIFGARAVDLAVQGGSAVAPLQLLAAIALLALCLAPVAMSAAMRISVES